jgi:hypothetical protein
MQKAFTLFISIFLFFIAGAQTQVQFINNSGDTLLTYAKVTMNGDLKKDSLGYRKATPFISTAGDSTYTIVFQSLLNSAKTASVTQTLQSGKKYVFVLNGVTDSSFQLNPDSVSTLLSIVTIDQSAVTAPASSEVEIALVNGSTDAPAFDLYATDSSNTLLVDNDSLNNFRTTTLDDTTLRLKLKTADGNFNISTFLFSLSGLGGQITTALTSGFLAPGSNHNGPNFSVYIVDSSGNVIPTQNVSIVHNRSNLFENILLYPNPATNFIHLNYTLSEAAAIKYEIFSLKGDVLQSDVASFQKGINEQEIELSNLPSGIYFLQLQSEVSSKTVSFIVK